MLCGCHSTGTGSPERLWILLFEDFQKQLGCGPGHRALDGSAGAGVGAGGPRGPCQPQPCCESEVSFSSREGGVKQHETNGPVSSNLHGSSIASARR